MAIRSFSYVPLLLGFILKVDTLLGLCSAALTSAGVNIGGARGFLKDGFLGGRQAQVWECHVDGRLSLAFIVCRLVRMDIW